MNNDNSTAVSSLLVVTPGGGGSADEINLYILSASKATVDIIFGITHLRSLIDVLLLDGWNNNIFDGKT